MSRTIQFVLLAVVAVCIQGAVHTQGVFAGTIYSGDSSGDLWTTDSDTGASSLVGTMGATQYDIAFNSSGDLYGVTSSRLYSIDEDTAATTLIGPTGVFSNGLEFSSGGTLYASGGQNLYTVNTSTGAATLVGDMGFSSQGDLAFAPDGSLFLTAAGGNLVSLNPGTGAGTLVGAIGFSPVHGIDFIGSTLYGITGGGELITINTSTGAGTLVANTSPTVNNYGSTVLIPEPGSLALVILGYCGLIACGLRRKRT